MLEAVFLKVEDVKRPLELGEKFLVPCVYNEEWKAYEHIEEDLWRDPVNLPNFVKKIKVTPIINHPHTDRENGQEEVHYHADYRFIKTIKGTNIPLDSHSNHTWGHWLRPSPEDFERFDEGIVYFLLPVVNLLHMAITDVSNIKSSKLKHKCAHKGKCPHRGYDLSQERAVDGVITCPLHGLKFDATTRKLSLI